MNKLSGFITGTLDLWFLFSALFAVFVGTTLWRAARRIRALRARVDKLERRDRIQEREISEPESSDWVPR
jgi:cell division protein FtsB